MKLLSSKIKFLYAEKIRNKCEMDQKYPTYVGYLFINIIY